MKPSSAFRSWIGMGVASALWASLVFGQQPSPAPQQPAPSPAPPSGGGPSSPATPGSRSPSPSIPSTPTIPSPTDRTRQPDFGTQRQQSPFPESRPIFLSGKVMMDDGTPPPESVVIERVCNGTPRPEAYTDSKGRFSFQLGQNTSVMADASVGGISDPMGGFGSRQSTTPGQPQGISERALMNCDLRASLPGYRSDLVSLAGRRMLDNPDVGTIILHRLGNVEGTTISATSLQAPKDAQKAFEKGADALKKKKYDEAQKQLEKAVELYPKYATAWFELGLLHQQRKQVDLAKKAYAQALAADSKFVKPYLQLTQFSVQEQKWQEVADTTSRVIKLNPFDFPSAYFYNSAANLNLRNLDAAEKSAREALKLDPQHRIPKTEHLLGIILANKQDYTGAAEHMKSYLQQAPEASDSDLVKKQLAEIERLLGARTASQPAAQPQQ